jgi:hypothetical protein
MMKRERKPIMKKMTCLSFVFAIVVLLCVSCVSVSAVQPAQLVTPTPEIFIALTQAVPGEFQPTAAPNLTPGTTLTFSPLTLTFSQAVASGASASNIPRLDSDEAAWWQKTPGHLQVSLNDYYVLQGKSHQPVVYVFPAQAYAELVPAAFESIHRLNNYLYDPNGIPALDQLTGVPFLNAKILFAAYIGQVSFQNGTGIRFLTEYNQYPASANNADLFYNFIGLTSDGAYYVVAIFPVSSPVLAETSDAGAPLPVGGIPYPSIANSKAEMDAYYIAVSDLLNVQLAQSFTPDLYQLDMLIHSMWIAP